MTVKLEDIANKLEETTNSIKQYLNTVTGEFVELFDSYYAENDAELSEKIVNLDEYAILPSQREIHEYDIMSDFAEIVPDPIKQSKLLYALNGKKPFRHFKDALIYTELDNDYYAFRNLRYIDIARHWCSDNEIQYVEKT